MKVIIFIFLVALTIECSSQIMHEPSYISQFGKRNLAQIISLIWWLIMQEMYTLPVQ